MRNSLKLIIRNLLRNPLTTLINLGGLSVSLALVLILSAYSYSEFTTDKFHKNHKNIYLIELSEGWVYTPAMLKNTIDNNLSGIEKTIRIRDKWKTPVYQFENEEPVHSDLIFADKEFFEVFDYKAIEGDLKSALMNPMSVVITKTLATRLFGKSTALGKTIQLDNSHNLTVMAVLDKQTANTIFSFQSICNIETIKRVQPNKGDFTMWGYKNYQTFVLLNPKSKPVEVCQTLINSIPEDIREKYTSASLMPFRSIYFSEIKNSFSYIKFGSKTKIIFFTIIAFLVLLIALVNFINITSARWNEKIKQTGIMKVIGAKRSIITLNLLVETFLFFISSFIIAIALASLLTPFLFQTTPIHFNLQLFYGSSFILSAIAGVIVLGFLCAIIPSLQIAKSDVLLNLKKKVVVKSEKSLGKGILVSLQFVIAIVLIVVTIIIQKQVNFGSNSLGVDEDNIVGIELSSHLRDKQDVLYDALMSQSSVESVTFTQYYPGGNRTSGWGMELRKDGEEKHVEFRNFSAESGFFDIMGLELVEGRFYDTNIATDKNKVVVNEQFVREHGISNPIGARMLRGKGLDYEIVGVVKDFNFKRVDESIAPLVIRNDKGAFFALVKLNTASFKALHGSFMEIKNIVNELSPALPSEVSFFDDAVHKMYQSEIMFRKAFTLFSLSAIIISCLGILAMSMFTTQRRIKEIGIRKVNGAKVSEILSMLNKDFIKWVAIAFVVACPIAYYAMNKWLENFAYKTTLSWWIFALAGLLALGIALLTVSWQSWRAATRNPVEALRYE